MNATPKIGTILRGDDGCALVVAEGTTPLDGLLTMMEDRYGGDRFSETNTAVLAALPEVRVEVWRSCTAAWCESEGIDPDEYMTGYWAPSGDGSRSITVAYYPLSVYGLGELAEDAEVSL